MSFYIIEELKNGSWVQADLAHYTLEQAERARDIYRMCLPTGNSMRLVKMRILEVLPADGDQ